eukprot:g42092.t1
MIIAYKEKKLNEIVVVTLSGRYLKNLGSLPHCSALKVCNLSRNYITKIDALAGCPNLIKLDLHGNHSDCSSNFQNLLGRNFHELIVEYWEGSFLFPDAFTSAAGNYYTVGASLDSTFSSS